MWGWPHKAVVRHWRGELSPAVALFGVLLGGRAAIWMALRALPYPLPGPVFVAVLALDALVLCWQLVGAWRAVRNRLEARADSLSVWGAQGIILAVPLMALVGWTDRASDQLLRPPPPKPPVQPLDILDSTAMVAGPMDFALMNRLAATPADSFDRIVLESDGGLIYAARGMARDLLARKVATEVRSACISACTLVFMAGTVRRLAPGASLGFHGYALQGGVPTTDVAREQAKDRAWLAARGVAEHFLDRIEATPHDRIWYPDRDTLFAAGVITQP